MICEKQKFDKALESGYKYNPSTGYVIGMTGIILEAKGSGGYIKFGVRINYDKKTVSLGSFDSEEESREAYLKAKKILHN